MRTGSRRRPPRGADAGGVTAAWAALSATLDSAIWRIIARCWEGRLVIRRGELGRGCDLMRDSLAICKRTGWRISYPEFMGSFAEGMAGLWQPDAALAIVDRAIARAEDGGERWYQPELLRIKILWGREEFRLVRCGGCWTHRRRGVTCHLQ